MERRHGRSCGSRFAEGGKPSACQIAPRALDKPGEIK